MIDSQNRMNQAIMTAHDYMSQAKNNINKMFGDGYAKAHPELVAAFMQVCVMDYMATAFEDRIEMLCNSLDAIAEALTSQEN